MAIHDYVDTLTTERNRAWEAQKEIAQRAVDEKRETTAEEREQIERTDADLDRLDAEIKGWIDREQRETESEKAREEWAKIVRPDAEEKRDTNEADFIRSVLRGDVHGGHDFDFAPVAAEKRAVLSRRHWRRVPRPDRRLRRWRWQHRPDHVHASALRLPRDLLGDASHQRDDHHHLRWREHGLPEGDRARHRRDRR